MYNPNEIEKKWQKFWEENKTFKTLNPWENWFDETKEKFYVLDMFPYPSWAWLHVGHPEWYTANDILARYKKTKGFNVLHPMWWDAFWLPAENYAIKTWTHPKITTEKNIETFKRQIKNLGFSYDWDREIDTTDTEYYKWTQWIFLKLFENGLAYEQDLPINYCPSCKTWLANEEVLNDFTCDRCGTKVEKKQLRQWVLAITKYAERLLNDVDKLDWPESIKEMQRNWIWKSEGTEFKMEKYLPMEELAINYFWGIYWYEVIWEKENSKEEVEEKLKKFQNDEKCIYIIKREDSYYCVFKFQNYDEYINYQIENKTKIWFPMKNFEESWVEKWQTVKDVLKNFEESNIIKSIWVIKNTDKIENPFIEVYTTRIDTVFGMTYAVLAPDHPKVWDFITEKQKEICQKYIDEASQKSDQDRTADTKEKTWVFTWSYVINPFNNQKVPLWIWDYVLWNYGTWAVMAVPAHDSRDFDFAKKYGLDIEKVIFSKEDFLKMEKLWEEIEDLDSYEELEKILSSENMEKAKTDDWIVFSYTNWSETKESENFKNEASWKTSAEARKYFTEYAEENWFGRKKINYKLRDWLFSRQRYWWEPIPLIHLENSLLEKLEKISDLSEAKDNSLAYILKRKPENWENTNWCSCSRWNIRELVINGKIFSKIYDWINWKIICDYNLPLELPEIDSYEPAWDWNSPLARVPEFVNVKLAENLSGKRETNTMPQWWWSCWYYLRFMDPKNSSNLVSKEIENYWDWVDSYVGWAEHAVLHLLYARFWHKFLFDIWVVKTDEPFHKLRNQGLILAHAYERQNWGLVAVDLVEEKDWKYFEISTGEEVKRIVSKMSKSLKNVVNPDDIVNEYGADSLRLYEMYMADFKDSAPWDTKWIIWVVRFLEKSERLFWFEAKISTENDEETMKLLHKTIKKVEEDIENYKFNTAIAALMILVNNWLPKDENLQKEWKNIFVRILHPFAPHLAEELWEIIWEKESVFFSSWPKYDENLVVDDEVTIWVQIMWKVRWEIKIWVSEDKDSVLTKAKSNEDVKKWIEWKEIVKEIYVPGKILNIVIK